MESISKLAQTPQNSHSIPGQSRNLGKTSPNNFWPKLAHHLLLEKVFLTKMSTPTTHRIASWLIQLKKINTLEKDKSTISPNVIKILWDRNLPKIMSTHQIQGWPVHLVSGELISMVSLRPFSGSGSVAPLSLHGPGILPRLQFSWVIRSPLRPQKLNI